MLVTNLLLLQVKSEILKKAPSGLVTSGDACANIVKCRSAVCLFESVLTN